GAAREQLVLQIGRDQFDGRQGDGAAGAVAQRRRQHVLVGRVAFLPLQLRRFDLQRIEVTRWRNRAMQRLAQGFQHRACGRRPSGDLGPCQEEQLQHGRHRQQADRNARQCAASRRFACLLAGLRGAQEVQRRGRDTV
ncbi:hypothetical protein COLO4_01698, partial [Corchorus olitorius]